MTIDSTAAPKTKRITGTLHMRGYVRPAPSRDENLPSEKTTEGEVEGRHKNSGQNDHDGVRRPMANCSPAHPKQHLG